MEHHVVVVSRPACGPCAQVKNLLRVAGFGYFERILGEDIDLEELERLLPGVRSVPQVWIEGEHIGGLQEVTRYLSHLP